MYIIGYETLTRLRLPENFGDFIYKGKIYRTLLLVSLFTNTQYLNHSQDVTSENLNSISLFEYECIFEFNKHWESGSFLTQFISLNFYTIPHTSGVELEIDVCYLSVERKIKSKVRKKVFDSRKCWDFEMACTFIFLS